MKTCGIIAEYNPFHKGHAYQIAEARKLTNADVMIAVMSGNFVQRGEPAIIDKWKRAECAIHNGIDLVIELPYVCATQSATQFAKGGISILKQIGADYISFGSECGNLENLQDIAETHINPDHLKEMMQTGMSYPKAYSLLTSEMASNDILAVSYLKELQTSSIQPVVIQRKGADYRDETIGEYASALAIRTELKKGNKLQTEDTPLADELNSSHLVYLEDYYPYFRTFLLTSSKESLGSLFLFDEGIENMMVKNALTCSTLQEFLSKCITHRYTAGRIKRCMLQALVQLTKKEKNALPKELPIRVLAANEIGCKWLSKKRKSDLEIASKFSKVSEPYRNIEYRTTLLYTSVLPEEERNRILKMEISGLHMIPTQNDR